MANHPSNSRPQQEAGKELVNTLSSELGVPLEQEKAVYLGSACKVVIDGYSADLPILCEAWAHYGKPKSAQTSKIMKDAIKLIFTEKCLGKEHRKILLFCDEDARNHFTGKSWQAKCLRDYSIETKTYSLPKELEQRIKKAQRLQFR